MFEYFIAQHKDEINLHMIELIEAEDIPESLKESMIYSIEIGGKRLRPILVFAVLKALGRELTLGYHTAAALEMIHTYSLIHDDLPAMDNDDLRRGKLTNHKVYGEAVAILAGDGLLTHAFSLISLDGGLSFEQRIKLIQELAQAAGPAGMIAGQVLDMEAETKSVSLAELKNIHAHKTGCLIEFAVIAGAIIGHAEAETLTGLRKFASHLGVAFQIRDDILDIEGDSDLIGKTVGSDLANNKTTYVSLTSLTEAKKMLEQEIASAIESLKQLPFDTKLLESITIFIKERQH